MTNNKTKYILSSVGTAAVGFASIVGSIGLLSGITPSVLAENLPSCTNVQQYDRWSSNATTISGPINVAEDIFASYVIPDQTERCKVEINLNGHTVTEAYKDQYTISSSLRVGKNAVVVVNGNGGTFAIGTPTDEPCTDICHSTGPNLGGASTTAIVVSDTGELVLNDVTVESLGYAIWNGGKTETNNVTAGIVRNNGGELIVNSGNYSSVGAEGGGTTTINGGSFNRICSETGSEVIVNDGTLKSNGIIKSYADMPRENVALPADYTGSKTNDITINGGHFVNGKVKSAVTVNGGEFKNTTFAYDTNEDQMITMGPDGKPIVNLEDSEISGGSFKDSKIDLNSEISGGTFKNTDLANDDITVSGGSFDTIPGADTISGDKKVIENDDGTYSVVDESAPGDEPLQSCEIRVYTDENNYTTFTGVINLTEDTVASYEVDDQSNTCRFTINLNGNKLTSVNNKEAISVGSNVSAKINGNDGKIEQSNTESTQESPAPAAVVVKDEGAASIKDVTIETKNDDAPAVSNSGRTTLTNVTAGENSNIENTDNGNLTIKSGNYNEVHSTDSGNTTIEGGTVETVTADNNSSVTVNNGTVNNITVNNDSGATINDGDFKDSNISSGDTGNNNVTVNGGDFTNAEVSSNNTTITGGDFSGATVSGNSEISGGTFNNATVSGNSEISGGTFNNATVSGSDTTITGGDFTNAEITTGNATINDGEFSGSTVSGNSEISGGNFNNATVGGDNTTISGGDFTNAEITSGNATISNGEFSGATVSGNSEISGGNFDNATVSGNSEISGGSFDNATVSGDDTTITGGTFRSTDISDNTTVTGGNFDVAPTVPEGSEVVTNNDGTVSIITAGNNSGNTGENSGNTSGTTPEEITSEENKLEVPNTGAMIAKELGSREMAIGVIFAAEAAILAVCGYIIHRIKKAYRIRFNH